MCVYAIFYICIIFNTIYMYNILSMCIIYICMYSYVWCVCVCVCVYVCMCIVHVCMPLYCMFILSFHYSYLRGAA